jgi:nitrite reductase (NADH) small subunit
LHGWNIALDSGSACAPDEGCARTFPVRIAGDAVWLPLEVLEPAAETELVT